MPRFENLCECGRKKVMGAIACGQCYAEAQQRSEHARYCGRTVEWGHWGITFMERQPDPTKNYGVIVGFVDFPVGTRGPMDGLKRDHYREICRAWVEQGVEPLGLRKTVETPAGCIAAQDMTA